MLGFGKEQTTTGLLSPMIGNTYSAAVLLGLASILDISKPGDRILAVAYGSGAGSDAFDITVTEQITELRKDPLLLVSNMISGGKYLDYATYAKFRGKITLAEGSK